MLFVSPWNVKSPSRRTRNAFQGFISFVCYKREVFHLQCRSAKKKILIYFFLVLFKVGIITDHQLDRIVCVKNVRNRVELVFIYLVSKVHGYSTKLPQLLDY